MRRTKSSPSNLDDLEKKQRESLSNFRANLEALARGAESTVAGVAVHLHNQLPQPPPKVVSMWKEFRDFAFQGSAIDLAVGIIVGGAFGKIVNSLVNDIIMPPIGWLLSGVDFANIFVLLKRGKKNRITKAKYKSLTHAKDDGAIAIGVGVFLNSVLNFVVISVIIFTFIRTVNQVKHNKEPKQRKCNFCFQKIDLRATRCSYCTSHVEKEDENEDKEEQEEQKPSTKYLKKNIKKQLSQVDFASSLKTL